MGKTKINEAAVGVPSLSNESRQIIENHRKVNIRIKHNLRREAPRAWWKLAKEEGVRHRTRPGKIVYRGATTRQKTLTLDGKEVTRAIRCVYQVIERTITAKGQHLLLPDIEVETYWTSLDHDPDIIIEQYHQHGTSE